MTPRALQSALAKVRRPEPAPEPELPAIEVRRDRDLDAISAEDRQIIEACFHHTMTGVLRLAALIDSVRHCVRRGLPGDFAECGVWRGGSVLAMLLTLREMGVEDRDVWLFDTFEGMTEPTEADRSDYFPPATELWERTDGRPWPEWFSSEVFNEELVRELISTAGYPAERIHFVKGPVEATIPEAAPERLALLRLDTDWYESTRHELVHLYPRLCPGGVLILDDYGHWDGARKAVDEYFAAEAEPLLLSRIDYSGRLAVKA
jgi:hypothetical protein